MQPPLFNYRKLVGAAAELKDMYYNYQKQTQSKKSKLEACLSTETQIWREKAYKTQHFHYLSVNLRTFSVTSIYICTSVEI